MQSEDSYFQWVPEIYLEDDRFQEFSYMEDVSEEDYKEKIMKASRIESSQFKNVRYKEGAEVWKNIRLSDGQIVKL